MAVQEGTSQIVPVVLGDNRRAMQVASALVKADRDFDLLVVPGAGHGAAETPYGKRRRMDFLVRNLLGVEPRAATAAPPSGGASKRCVQLESTACLSFLYCW